MEGKVYPFQPVNAFGDGAQSLTRSGRVYTLARLMSGLPQFFEPIRLAEQGAAISGDLAVSQFLRLRGSLHDASGTVHVRLTCSPGDAGAIRIQGSLSTVLKVDCQRCLGAFDLPLEVNLDALAAPETRVGTDPDREVDVWMGGEDNRVHLCDFVEDELILAVPLAPLHPAGKCPVAGYHPEHEAQRENPFAALKSLKLKKD
jgi:uncharacterized protein